MPEAPERGPTGPVGSTTGLKMKGCGRGYRLLKSKLPLTLSSALTRIDLVAEIENEADMTGDNGKIKYRAPEIDRVAEANLPTEFGCFRIVGFKEKSTGEEFVALVKGQLDQQTPTLVRIHSQCLTGDVFYSIKCDCGRQLQMAMKLIEDEGCGVIVYQQQEGRGIGIMNKIRAYSLQDAGMDTVEANISLGFEADLRQYASCAEIISQLGVRRVRIMSNNPDKIEALGAAGIEVVERVPMEVQADARSLDYLKTKKEKLGHMLDQIS